MNESAEDRKYGVNLLVLTQAVDLNDPVLGFFHGWIVELSKHYEKIHVICLKEGKHLLPANVVVHSLGKESGVSRLVHLARFYRYIWTLRHEYDAVFVHMNPEYVVLGRKSWFLLRKKVYLWRNHYSGGFLTVLAVLLSRKVFCTSRFSFTARFKKTRIMPVGVNFAPITDVVREPRSILFLARIAPSKRPDMLLRALRALKERGIPCSASVYGSSLAEDEQFATDTRAFAQKEGLNVVFHEGVPHQETPRIFASHDIFVNLSASGMYDKTLFEAAAAGCLVLASSRDFAALVDARFVFAENDIDDLARKLEALLALPEREKESAREKFKALAETQSLQRLVDRLVEEMR